MVVCLLRRNPQAAGERLAHASHVRDALPRHALHLAHRLLDAHPADAVGVWPVRAALDAAHRGVLAHALEHLRVALLPRHEVVPAPLRLQHRPHPEHLLAVHVALLVIQRARRQHTGQGRQRARATQGPRHARLIPADGLAAQEAHGVEGRGGLDRDEHASLALIRVGHAGIALGVEGVEELGARHLVLHNLREPLPDLDLRARRDVDAVEREVHGLGRELPQRLHRQDPLQHLRHARVHGGDRPLAVRRAPRRDADLDPARLGVGVRRQQRAPRVSAARVGEVARHAHHRVGVHHVHACNVVPHIRALPRRDRLELGGLQHQRRLVRVRVGDAPPDCGRLEPLAVREHQVTAVVQLDRRVAGLAAQFQQRHVVDERVRVVPRVHQHGLDLKLLHAAPLRLVDLHRVVDADRDHVKLNHTRLLAKHAVRRRQHPPRRDQRACAVRPAHNVAHGLGLGRRCLRGIGGPRPAHQAPPHQRARPRRAPRPKSKRAEHVVQAHADGDDEGELEGVRVLAADDARRGLAVPLVHALHARLVELRALAARVLRLGVEGGADLGGGVGGRALRVRVDVELGVRAAHAAAAAERGADALHVLVLARARLVLLRLQLLRALLLHGRRLPLQDRAPRAHQLRVRLVQPLLVLGRAAQRGRRRRGVALFEVAGVAERHHVRLHLARVVPARHQRELARARAQQRKLPDEVHVRLIHHAVAVARAHGDPTDQRGEALGRDLARHLHIELRVKVGADADVKRLALRDCTVAGVVGELDPHFHRHVHVVVPVVPEVTLERSQRRRKHVIDVLKRCLRVAPASQEVILLWGESKRHPRLLSVHNRVHVGVCEHPQWHRVGI
mmetsp:Transcript_56014/g.131915  ORF Transcript_56014/g.131915 Transcript_56014/m.131915 type:complete len:846 (+) Transcript_56014:797-3334(+)